MKKKSKIKVKIKLKNALLFSSVIFSVVLAIRFLPTIYRFFTPITSINYHGHLLLFRSDLKKAKKIPVYPSSEAVKEVMMQPTIKKITIFFQDTEDNSLTAVESYEITYILKTVYLVNGFSVDFSGELVDDFQNIKSSEENPGIVLIPPSLANETFVRIEGYKVIISGKDAKEFDLATDKFLMDVIGIKV